jgi:hypothetical protein
MQAIGIDEDLDDVLVLDPGARRRKRSAWRSALAELIEH